VSLNDQIRNLAQQSCDVDIMSMNFLLSRVFGNLFSRF